jgi:Fe2+ transport system protein B
MWPKFATEPCNARLGLATNVVNPFGAQSSTWSTWLVMLQIYNLPPWLVTKNFFVILTLIIPGKESMKMHNINVYMAPLIKELQVLWKGVAAYDVARVERQ